MSKNEANSMDAYYHDYNAQLSQLKKKHLAETQALEQKLLMQKQELERVLSLNSFPSFQSDQFLNFDDSVLGYDFNFIKDSSDSQESKKLKKKASSRHSSSVISHFTSSNEGYRRLAQELEGFLFILSSQGTILFASNSCQKYLGTSTVSMLGQSLGKYLHPDDEEFVMAKLRDAFSWIKSLHVYCRFKRELSETIGASSSDSVDAQTILMEMNGRPVIEEGESCPIFLVNVGREYRSKNSTDLDSILTLRMENIKLRLKLKAELDQRTFQASTGDFNTVETELPAKSPAIANSKKEETTRRRKKAKISVADLVCKECGTNSSPEWRRGPEGPKTLCNACGLLFAKRMKLAAQAPSSS